MADPIPVLSLDQPWATLVALGVKKLETRSFQTKYRGPLAIHATLNRPKLMHLPRLWSRGKTRDEQDRWNKETWSVIDTITDPKYQGPQPMGRRIPKRAQTPTLFFPNAGPHGRRWDESLGTSATEQGSAMYLPLGCIVAVCELVDCAPMGGPTSFSTGIVEGEAPDFAGRHVLVIEPLTGELALDHPAGCGHTVGTYEDVTDQKPFGDFRHGRWAWILDNVHAFDEPILFRGGQGLSKRWTPDYETAQ